MPSTYTVNLGIEKPATGEQSGSWGDTTNINFDILDQAINGCLSLTLVSAGNSGSPNTLAISDGATSNGRNKWVEFVDGGDLGATAYVQLTPNDAEKIVFVRNSLSGSRPVILFQGTYNAGRDLEVPAGVDMVVKFSGGGASATTTNVFQRLRVEELNIAGTITVDGVIDDDTMATASATKLATSESIKTYVDTQVGANNELSEVLANGNTTGANNIIVDSGQAITTNTINETTAGSGVTIDSVLLKDDGVNATNLGITNIKANDGTAAGSIANGTGAVTIPSFISNSVDIGGGAIDDVVIGGSTPAALSGTTGQFGTSLNVDGTVTADGLTVDGTVTTNGAIYGPQANSDGFITAEITQSHLGSDSSGTADITYTLTLTNTSGVHDNWQVMMYLTTAGNSFPAKTSVYEIRGSQRSGTASVNRTTLVSGESRTITFSVSGLVVTFTLASEGSSTATQGAKFCFVGGTYGCASVAVGDSS